MNSKNSRYLAIAAVVLLSAAGLGGALWSKGSGAAADDKKAAPPKPALTVTTALPQRVSLPIRLPANGNIAAWQEASVGAEGSGLRLTEVRVNVGDRVKRGQVLATFATDTLGAEAAQTRAAVAEAEAAAADAAANAERARKLQPSGALSASQIAQYLTAEKTAQARVQAARATAQAQQARLNQSQVRAPDDGIISARTATVGAVVGPGTELFRLIRQGRLEWRAEVTSTELGRITAGTRAVVMAASGAGLEGRVRMIGPTVDPQTRAALVYVDLSPLPGPFSGSARAGMFARGEFELGATPALMLPQTAVLVRDGFSHVYQLGTDNRVSQVRVQTGRLAGDRIEITSGLPADARVVASGAGFLNDGDVVRVADATAATGATVAPGVASAPPSAPQPAAQPAAK